MASDPDLHIEFVGPSDLPAEGEDLPHRTRSRPPRWVGALAALLVVGGVGVVLARDPAPRVAPPSVTSGSVPAPSRPPLVLAREISLSDIVGDRCPMAVACGVSPILSPGTSQRFRAVFPTVAIGIQARAFSTDDTVYWQQITGRAAQGLGVVATEQRLPAPGPARAVSVTGRAGAHYVVVAAVRGRYEISVGLTSEAGVPDAAIRAARAWVSTTPLPREPA